MERLSLRKALIDMISHGHRDRAIEYLSDPTSIGDYPFVAAFQALGYRSTDDTTRQRVLSTAIEAMRRQMRDRTASTDQSQFHEFVRLFDAHWRVLPTEDARAFVRDTPTPAGPTSRDDRERELRPLVDRLLADASAIGIPFPEILDYMQSLAARATKSNKEKL